MFKLRGVAALLFLFVLFFASFMAPARAADPIKVGFSMALTGSVAQNGKQLIIALELWRDDVNANGGLLGRPVQLVYYDDQSNPGNVPGIYTKLITIDKVDLLLGPYATNMAAAAMPVIMQHNMMTISILAVDVNRHFHYSRYFDMIPVGPEGTKAFSRGFSRSRRRSNRSRKPSRLSPPTRNFPKPRPTARERTPTKAASRSFMIKAIRRAPPISRQ
jgi:branched-chain amino acid transport system substrate-binding protein